MSGGSGSDSRQKVKKTSRKAAEQLARQAATTTDGGVPRFVVGGLVGGEVQRSYFCLWCSFLDPLLVPIVTIPSIT